MLKEVGLLEFAQQIEGDVIKAKVQEHKTENTKLKQQLETQRLQLHETVKEAKQLQKTIGQKVLHKCTYVSLYGIIYLFPNVAGD